jgi:hypothetical protein
MVAHPVEALGIGALKGIDRLFLVADDEDRASDLRTRPLPDGEVLGQTIDDVPLRGAGVLCFVYKNVVDPAIQPEQHPLRDAGGTEQNAASVR